MKKTYIYPKLNVIDLKDEICDIMTGSTGDSTDPNLGTDGGTDGNVGEEGGDVRRQGGFDWTNEW